MPQKAGRPKRTPKKVMVTLPAHHAEQLQQLADDNNTKLATLCGNILERYIFEEQGILASDILKNAVVDTVHKEMTSHNNRIRSLLARTAYEAVATRQVAKNTLQAFLRSDEADLYNEQAWAYATHVLSNPTPEIRQAISLLSENIANDDPGILLKVRESAEEVSRVSADVQSLTQQVALLVEGQKKMLEASEKTMQRLRILEEHAAEADTRAAESFIEALKGLEEKQGKGVAEKVINMLRGR